MPAPFPLVNGNEYEFASITLRVPGSPTPIFGAKDISYKHSLKPGKKRGTFAQVTGRTRGVYDAEGALTIYKPQAADFVAAIAALGAAQGLGYMEAIFGLQVDYEEVVLGIVTDKLKKVRISDEEDQHQEGSDVLVTKFTLDIIELVKNGQQAVASRPGSPGGIF